MEHGGLSASDVLALTNNRDGYADGMGGQFWWVIVFLIVASMFRGNGLFGNDGTATNAVLGSDEFIKRDIFNTNQNVSTTSCQTQRDVLESRYTNQLGLQQVQANQQNCCCETQKEILQSRYDNALQGNTLQAQMAQCCCDLKSEGLANTQKILDKLCENEINQLRTELQSAQFQISQLSQTANITNTLRPFPIPAYITASPYQSYGYGTCGCGCGF
jgi:hypothetical protein